MKFKAPLPSFCPSIYTHTHTHSFACFCVRFRCGCKRARPNVFCQHEVIPLASMCAFVCKGECCSHLHQAKIHVVGKDGTELEVSWGKTWANERIEADVDDDGKSKWLKFDSFDSHVCPLFSFSFYAAAGMQRILVHRTGRKKEFSCYNEELRESKKKIYSFDLHLKGGFLKSQTTEERRTHKSTSTNVTGIQHLICCALCLCSRTCCQMLLKWISIFFRILFHMRPFSVFVFFGIKTNLIVWEMHSTMTGSGI